MDKPQYNGLLKWTQYILIRLLIKCLQSLPLSINYYLGRLIGLVLWKLLRKRRKVVHRNLTIVGNWMREKNIETQSFEDLETQVREVFMRFGGNLFSSFSLSKMSKEKLSKHLEIEGANKLRDALAEGNGVVMVTAHMGPWEVLAHLQDILNNYGVEAPIASLYRPLNNDYLEKWYKTQREAQGTQMLSHKDGFHKPVDFLRSGGMLIILADQRMRQGVNVPFFGKVVETMPLPGLFVRRSGASLISISLITIRKMQWRLRCERIEFEKEADLSSREVCATHVNQALERSLSYSVLDGFWLHKRFK